MFNLTNKMQKKKNHPIIQFSKINWDLNDTNIKNPAYVDHDWLSNPVLLLYKTEIKDFLNIIHQLDWYGKLWEWEDDEGKSFDKLERIIGEWNSGKNLSPIEIFPQDNNHAVIKSGNHRFTILYNAYKQQQLQQKELYFLIPQESNICDTNDPSKTVKVDCKKWIANKIIATFVKEIYK